LNQRFIYLRQFNLETQTYGNSYYFFDLPEIDSEVNNNELQEIPEELEIQLSFNSDLEREEEEEGDDSGYETDSSNATVLLPRN